MDLGLISKIGLHCPRLFCLDCMVLTHTVCIYVYVYIFNISRHHLNVGGFWFLFKNGRCGPTCPPALAPLNQMAVPFVWGPLLLDRPLRPILLCPPGCLPPAFPPWLPCTWGLQGSRLGFYSPSIIFFFHQRWLVFSGFFLEGSLFLHEKSNSDLQVQSTDVNL